MILQLCCQRINGCTVPGFAVPGVKTLQHFAGIDLIDIEFIGLIGDG